MVEDFLFFAPVAERAEILDALAEIPPLEYIFHLRLAVLVIPRARQVVRVAAAREIWAACVEGI